MNAQALPEFSCVIHIYGRTSNQTFAKTALLRKSDEGAHILWETETEEDTRLTSGDRINRVGHESSPVLVRTDAFLPLHVNEAQVPSYR